MITIRPSSADRIVKCPGSRRAAQDAPDWSDEYDDTTVRDEGTACHWLAHEMSTGLVGEHIGATAPNGVIIDHDMVSAANMYLGEIYKRNLHTHFEHPVGVPQLPYVHGTPDAFSIDRPLKTVHVDDLKYGYRIVDAWPNYQMLCYCLGAADYFREDYRELTFRITITQPRRWHRAGPVRTEVVTGLELAARARILRTAIIDSLEDEPPLIPGDHCRHCPGRARCGALRDAVSNGVYVDSHDLPFADAEKELQYLERYGRLVEAYTSGLRAQVEHGLRNGQRSAMYELRRKTGALAWKPEAIGTVKSLAHLLGVNIEKEPKLITPTQARPLLGDIANMYAERLPGSVDLVATDVEALKRLFEK